LKRLSRAGKGKNAKSGFSTFDSSPIQDIIFFCFVSIARAVFISIVGLNALRLEKSRAFSGFFKRHYKRIFENQPRRSRIMSQICHICGKGPAVGNNVSHAHNKTKRRFMPNLQRVKIEEKGATKRVLLCTRCIRTANYLK